MARGGARSTIVVHHLVDQLAPGDGSPGGEGGVGEGAQPLIAKSAPCWRTRAAPAARKCAGRRSAPESAACCSTRRREARAAAGSSQKQLPRSGCPTWAGLCRTSPANTARSAPDASQTTAEPGVCPAASSRVRSPSIRCASPSHTCTWPAASTGATLSSKAFWLPRPKAGRWSFAGSQKSSSVLLTR